MPNGDKARPSQEDVRRKAYEIYSARGRADGKALDDWLKAEQELRFGASGTTEKTSR